MGKRSHSHALIEISRFDSGIIGFAIRTSLIVATSKAIPTKFSHSPTFFQVIKFYRFIILPAIRTALIAPFFLANIIFYIVGATYFHLGKRVSGFPPIAWAKLAALGKTVFSSLAFTRTFRFPRCPYRIAQWIAGGISCRRTVRPHLPHCFGNRFAA